jgi:hypothetical protein
MAEGLNVVEKQDSHADISGRFLENLVDLPFFRVLQYLEYENISRGREGRPEGSPLTGTNVQLCAKVERKRFKKSAAYK